jgi:hypothetical protein
VPSRTVRSELQQLRSFQFRGHHRVYDTPPTIKPFRGSRLSDANATLADIIEQLPTDIDHPDARTFLKCGRHLIEIRR